MQPFYYEDKEGGRSRKWLYGIIALLVAVIAGGGYFLYTQNEEINKSKELAYSIARADSLKKTSAMKAKVDSIEAEKQKLEDKRKALEEKQKKAEEERKMPIEEDVCCKHRRWLVVMA